MSFVVNLYYLRKMNAFYPFVATWTKQCETNYWVLMDLIVRTYKARVIQNSQQITVLSSVSYVRNKLILLWN